MRYLLAWGASALVFLLMDGVWLTVMGNRLYRPVLGDMMAAKVNLPAAILFYVVFITGLTFLATAPAIREASALKAVINAAVFGFAAYATYDLTNQATLARWSTVLTLSDLAWGTTVSVVAAVAGYHASRLIA